MDIFLIFFNMKVCSVFSLETPHRAIEVLLYITICPLLNLGRLSKFVAISATLTYYVDLLRGICKYYVELFKILTCIHIGKAAVYFDVQSMHVHKNMPFALLFLRELSKFIAIYCRIN